MTELTFRARCAAVVLSWAWLLPARMLPAAEPQTVDSDQSAVYRIQPSVEGVEAVAVPPDEVKSGLAYNYFNARLGRRVWGFARDGGSFQYAFGEGTTLPVDHFDLRVTRQMREEILLRRDPGLERELEITGRFPSVELESSGQWRLLDRSSVARIFDLETGHRWEWHGGRRVAVLHTGGDRWEIAAGHYRPATGGSAIVPCGCGLARVGSAAFVLRTSEPSTQR